MTAAALAGQFGSINARVRRRRRLVVAGLVAPALLVVCGALLVPALNLIVQSFLESSAIVSRSHTLRGAAGKGGHARSAGIRSRRKSEIEG